MNFDALTTAAIRDELVDQALGGRIQRILLPSEDSLALEIYAHHHTIWLLVSIHPQHTRVHLLSHKPQRMVETESPLLLLLRKYIRDGRLTNVEQLPWERVLVLTVTKRMTDSTDLEERTTDRRVIIEIMGRYSNIILIDDQGLILDSAKRVYPQMNRYRTIMPRHPYVPPPAQNKLTPDSSSAEDLAPALAATPTGAAWEVLVRSFRAVSPLLAREVIYRATGHTSASAADILSSSDGVDKVNSTLRELFQSENNHHWHPSVADDDQGVSAFAPYLLTHLPGVREMNSVSEAIDAFFETERTTSRSHQLARAGMLKLIDEERQRLLRKQESLRRGLDRAAEANRLRTSGELLLTYANQVETGQQSLTVGDIEVKLDPQLTPVENAQAYFREYGKAKAAHEEIPALLEQTQLALAYLDQTAELTELAADARTIAALRAELAEAGFGRTVKAEPAKTKKTGQRGPAKTKKAGPSPLKLRFDGFEVWVGRSGRENEEMTFGLATGNDIWLHARGVPGAHVLLRTTDSEPSPATLRAAAAIAAKFSQARQSTSVPVDYTRRRHVRKIKGAPPGMVSYTHETTLVVQPAH